MKTLIYFLLAALFMFTPPASNRLFAAELTMPELDVPFVPTDESVVTAMIHLAGVNSNDVLYDLGSGDGRIVIQAAKQTGCRGVGIDIDPVRVEEARDNLRRAGVEGVEFRQGDLFEADISEASVVAIYLLQSVNLRLRPKLLGELRPGARVVSHAFDMGEWQTDAQRDVAGANIYYWVIPANISGTWEWQNHAGEKEAIEINQRFQAAKGVHRGNNNSSDLGEIKIHGTSVAFSGEASHGGRFVPAKFAAELVSKDVLNGTITTDYGVFQWQATRRPGTRSRIDGE